MTIITKILKSFFITLLFVLSATIIQLGLKVFFEYVNIHEFVGAFAVFCFLWFCVYQVFSEEWKVE